METKANLSGSQIPERVYFRIGDVAEAVGVKPYVLRYWETEFSVISPQKSATGQRVYKKQDVDSLMMIKHLLYVERYSIEGAKKRIRELRKAGGLRLYQKSIILNPRPVGETLHPTSEPVSETVEKIEVAPAAQDRLLTANAEAHEVLEALDALVAQSIGDLFSA